MHEAVADAFVAALVERAEAMVVGDPMEEATDLGPLVDARQVELVDAHVREAVEGGATLACGGRPLDRPGCYYPPTVLTGVSADQRVVREETFGPVAPVVVVPSFDAAIAHANASEYGLAAVVLTGSMAHAQRAVRELAVGTVKVNAAFGGAPGGAATPHGASGMGFGYGPELLDELTRTRVAHVEPPP